MPVVSQRTNRGGGPERQRPVQVGQGGAAFLLSDNQVGERLAGELIDDMAILITRPV